MPDEFIAGRNGVLEALKAGRPINKILVAKGERQGSVREIIALAREQGLVVQDVDSAKLDSLTQGLKHQGVVAAASPVDYVEVSDLWGKAGEKNEPPFFILLDELEDPHNLGAILRTADAAGAHGVLIPRRRSCPLSGTVAKTSAGAIEYVPVARIGNVAQTLNELKKRGCWIVGADMTGSQNYYQADLTGPIVVVIGNEGQGLSRLTKETCDFLVKIPMKGKIASLNASVACSLILYEVFRQRQGDH